MLSNIYRKLKLRIDKTILDLMKSHTCTQLIFNNRSFGIMFSDENVKKFTCTFCQYIGEALQSVGKVKKGYIYRYI